MVERKRTSAPPKTVDGVVFQCWKTGIMQTTWISEDERASIWLPSMRSTYSASVDGKRLGSRFRSQTNAMKAAAKAMKK